VAWGVYGAFTEQSYNRAMPPNLPIVVSANAALAAPDTRERIKQMHAAGDSLVKMVGALGLPLEEPVRWILEALPPEVVDGIRQATLAALEAGGSELPLNCAVTEQQLDAGQAVDVDVADVGGTRTIRVRPAS
jgi:hypothetical protein